MKYSKITQKVIGCAMKVHTTLGNGFQEKIYQRALAIELEHNHIGFTREQEMDIFYHEVHIGTRRVDFCVEGFLLVELKAVLILEGAHLAQAMNYLEAYDSEIGLLINFGAPSLQFKRIYNNKLTKLPR